MSDSNDIYAISEIKTHLNSLLKQIQIWKNLHKMSCGEFQVYLNVIDIDEEIESRLDSVTKFRQCIDEFKNILSEMKKRFSLSMELLC